MLTNYNRRQFLELLPGQEVPLPRTQGPARPPAAQGDQPRAELQQARGVRQVGREKIVFRDGHLRIF